MGDYYLPGEVYSELLNYLTPDQQEDFAEFFQPVNGNYHCTNYSGYMNWLQGLFESDDPDEYGLFVAWDFSLAGNSGQSGGGY